MDIITSYIYADKEAAYKASTEEMKNLPCISEKIDHFFDSDEYIKRVYAKVMSYAYDGFAEKNDVYITVMVGCKDDEASATESMISKKVITFHFDKETKPQTSWESLNTTAEDNYSFLKIAYQIHSQLMLISLANVN